MKVTMEGQYQTQAGLSVRIIAVNRKNESGYCVVGLVHVLENREEVQVWKIDGTREGDGWNLVPVLTKHTGWMVLYSNYRKATDPDDLVGHVYPSYLNAEIVASVLLGDRVVAVTWEE
jgi:hypothetical protein